MINESLYAFQSQCFPGICFSHCRFHLNLRGILHTHGAFVRVETAHHGSVHLKARIIQDYSHRELCATDIALTSHLPNVGCPTFLLVFLLFERQKCSRHPPDGLTVPKLIILA